MIREIYYNKVIALSVYKDLNYINDKPHYNIWVKLPVLYFTYSYPSYHIILENN